VVYDGVAGVIAAAIAHHQTRLARQQINQVALAFIAPLGTD
jgi:hypothetical protein